MKRPFGTVVLVGLVVASLGFALVVSDPPSAGASETPHASYINATHRLFLGRRASVSETNQWRSSVSAGRRTELTDHLATSDEWAGSEVNKLYLKILRRPADASGRAYWVDGIQNQGVRLEDVASYFYGGPEYFSRASNSNSKFIDSLYVDLLGRRADASGRNYWLDRMASGMGRSAVAANFYQSIESRTSRVRSLYRTVLARQPDSSGLGYWAEQLRTIGDVRLAAFLAASDEYYQRVNRPRVYCSPMQQETEGSCSRPAGTLAMSSPLSAGYGSNVTVTSTDPCPAPPAGGFKAYVIGFIWREVGSTTSAYSNVGEPNAGGAWSVSIKVPDSGIYKIDFECGYWDPGDNYSSRYPNSLWFTTTKTYTQRTILVD